MACDICGCPTSNPLCKDCDVADRNDDTARSLGNETPEEDNEGDDA